MEDGKPGASLPYLDRDIGKHSYRAVRLPLIKWAGLGEHLAIMLGKPLGDLFRGRGVDLAALDGAGLDAVAIASILERLTAANMLELLQFAKGSLRLQSETGGFNSLKIEQLHMHFASYMAEMAPALRLFLEAQYADFFSGLKSCFGSGSGAEGDQDPGTLRDSTPSAGT